MNNNWKSFEANWKLNNSSELSAFLEVCSLSHDILADLTQLPDYINRPRSSIVDCQHLLFPRIRKELRGVELLAENGYGFQSISAAANIFEQSHFLAWASASEEISAQYLNNKKLKDSVSTVKFCVEASGELRGWSKERVEEEYKLYRLLCSFKHNNARVHRIMKLPDAHLYLGQLAISQSIEQALSAVGVMVFGIPLTENLLNYLSSLFSILEMARRLPIQKDL